MAGYVKLQRSIWQDPEFVQLPPGAQRLYLLLISQPDITHVGILPLMPARWSRFCADSTPADVRTDLSTLVAARFVLVDESTEEVWVRSYLVHDEAYNLTNGKKSLARAHAQVLSAALRNAIARVLVTVDVTVDSTLEVSQQPAASSHSQQPFPAATGDEFPDIADPVVAGALLLLLNWKCSTARNPGGLRRKLLAELPAEHGESLAAYLAAHPDATAEELAAHVLKVPGTSVPQSEPRRDWYADPTCATCAGDGMANTAPEGTPATYGPCDCRRTEPYMATIHELRPA